MLAYTAVEAFTAWVGYGFVEFTAEQDIDPELARALVSMGCPVEASGTETVPPRSRAAKT